MLLLFISPFSDLRAVLFPIHVVDFMRGGFENLLDATKVKDLPRDAVNPYCREPGEATVDFVVVFEKPVFGEFKKNKDRYCQALEVVETSEDLELFLSGFLFADIKNGTGGRELRNAMNKRILQGRRGQSTLAIACLVNHAVAKAQASNSSFLTIPIFIFSLVLIRGIRSPIFSDLTRAANIAVGEDLVCTDSASQVSEELIAFPLISAVLLPISVALILTCAFPLLLKLSKVKLRRVRAGKGNSEASAD